MQLQVACTAAAFGLLFTLLALPATPAPVTPASAAAVPVSHPFVENPLAAAPLIPQACIKRVLALSRKQMHFDLVGVMERDCFGVVAAPVSGVVAALPACLHTAGWHPAYDRPLATGCLRN